MSLDRSKEQSGGYYLVVARLLPYKRVDLAIRTCMKRDAHLVVVGEGPERSALMRIAGENIVFRPQVDDDELAGLYGGAKALLQCGKEDFGIAPLEANASGRPVVAYAAGGALDTVLDGHTGILFHQQTEESLRGALDRLESGTWKPDDLRRHAARFGEERFRVEIHGAIQEALKMSRSQA
jgi:glycosyltransferase involved in cell wall biosynthesis